MLLEEPHHSKVWIAILPRRWRQLVVGMENGRGLRSRNRNQMGSRQGVTFL